MNHKALKLRIFTYFFKERNNKIASWGWGPGPGDIG